MICWKHQAFLESLRQTRLPFSHMSSRLRARSRHSASTLSSLSKSSRENISETYEKSINQSLGRQPLSGFPAKKKWRRALKKLMHVENHGKNTVNDLCKTDFFLESDLHYQSVAQRPNSQVPFFRSFSSTENFSVRSRPKHLLSPKADSISPVALRLKLSMNLLDQNCASWCASVLPTAWTISPLILKSSTLILFSKPTRKRKSLAENAVIHVWQNSSISTSIATDVQWLTPALWNKFGHLNTYRNWCPMIFPHEGERWKRIRIVC